MCTFDSALLGWFETSKTDVPAASLRGLFRAFDFDQVTPDDHRFMVGVDGKLLHTPPGKNTPQTIKPGKMVALAMPDHQYDSTTIEQFVNCYKATFMMSASGTVEVLSGEAIREGYRTCNYYDGHCFGRSGELWGSCMNNDTEYLDLYVKNPQVCRLVTLTYTDADGSRGIVARALLWETRCGKTLLDRVYFTAPCHATYLEKWARDQGYWRRDDRNDFYPPGSNTYSDHRFFVDLEEVYFDYYPYVDTFHYLDRTGRVLSNEPLYALTLDETDGSFSGDDGYEAEPEQTWSEYENQYIDEGDAVWSPIVQSYISDGNAAYINGSLYPTDHDEVTPIRRYARRYDSEYALLSETFDDVEGDTYHTDEMHLFANIEDTGECIRLDAINFSDHVDEGDWLLVGGERQMFLNGELVEEDQVRYAHDGTPFVEGDADYVCLTIDDGSLTGREEWHHWTTAGLLVEKVPVLQVA